MKVSADAFPFDFTDAVDAFRFDEQDSSAPRFHGLSHIMKAVDVVVELPGDYLLVEVKDYRLARRPFPTGFVRELAKDLRSKFRDSFLYRWCEDKTDKPVHYLCMLEIETNLLLRLQAEVARVVPAGRPHTR